MPLSPACLYVCNFILFSNVSHYTLTSVKNDMRTGRRVKTDEGYNIKEHNWKQKAQILQARLMIRGEFMGVHRIDTVSVVRPKLLSIFKNHRILTERYCI